MAYIYDLVDTWNDAGVTFTAMKMNVTDTASAAASLLMDLQVGGVSKFAVRKDGTLPQGILFSGDNLYDIGNTASGRPRSGYFGTSLTVPTINGSATGTTGLTLNGDGTNGQVILNSVVGAQLKWASRNITLDGNGIHFTGSINEVSNVLEMRNGVNGQSFRTYASYTDVNNWSRVNLNYDAGGTFNLLTEALGTGTILPLLIGSLGNAKLSFVTQGTQRFSVNGGDGHFAPGLNNIYDVGSPALLIRSGYFGTSVVTPNIAFPATQVASADANTLDDYEEGTFTPTISFAGASVGITYATQTGVYTKVGNVVHFKLFINLSNKGSSVGAVRIEGLPFTAAAGIDSPVSAYTHNTVSMTTLPIPMVQPGLAYALLYQGIDSKVAVTNTEFANTTQVYLAGSYFV